MCTICSNPPKFNSFDGYKVVRIQNGIKMSPIGNFEYPADGWIPKGFYLKPNQISASIIINPKMRGSTGVFSTLTGAYLYMHDLRRSLAVSNLCIYTARIRYKLRKGVISVGKVYFRVYLGRRITFLNQVKGHNYGSVTKN